MKLNRLETHDRLQHLMKDQAINISMGAEDCLKRNPDSLFMQDRSPYIYIFGHPRTADDGVTKRMLWQPRLTRPQVQDNSYLFRAESKTDFLEICWLLPPESMWKQYEKKNVTESQWVMWSIDQYKYNRKQLEKADKDDLSEERIKHILTELAQNYKHKDKVII